MRNHSAVTAALILAVWGVLGGSPAGAVTAEDGEIRGAALDYAEGWLTGDEARMARVLHPEMLKRRVVTDILTELQSVQSLDTPTLLHATGEGIGLGGGTLDFRVTILDRHGDMAVVRLVSSLYVEYLQMVRWEGRWVILSVLWGALDLPEEQGRAPAARGRRTGPA